jgi:hypothetical protein
MGIFNTRCSLRTSGPEADTDSSFVLWVAESQSPRLEWINRAGTLYSYLRSTTTTQADVVLAWKWLSQDVQIDVRNRRTEVLWLCRNDMSQSMNDMEADAVFWALKRKASGIA